MVNKKVDFSKKAKPIGLRFRGSKKKLGSKYYKRPERVYTAKGLEAAKTKGLVYYEPRISKGDHNQAIRFKKGGLLSGSILTKRYSLAEIFGF